MVKVPGQPVIAIDLLRVAAAAMVVLYHFGAASPIAPTWQARVALGDARLPATMAGWTWAGWVGVEIFFVISGRVIAASAEHATPAAFLKRRAWRLWPAVALCATITAVALALSAPGLPVAMPWARSMLMLPSAYGVDPSYWTLTIEWAFYGLVAAVLTGGGSRARLERAALALGWASAAFWVAMAWLPAGLPGDVSFQLTLLPHGCFFALGALGRRASWPTRIALLGAAAAEIIAHAHAIAAMLRGPASPAAPLLLFTAALAALGAADRIQPVLARWLGEGGAARAAAATYPLYLLHQVAGAALVAALVGAGLAVTPAIALATVASVATAGAVAWGAEPAIRTLRYRARPPGTCRTASLRAG